MYDEFKPLTEVFIPIAAERKPLKYYSEIVKWSLSLFQARDKCLNNLDDKFYEFIKSPKKAMIYFDAYMLRLCEIEDRLLGALSQEQKVYAAEAIRSIMDFMYREYMSKVIYNSLDVFETPFNDIEKITAGEKVNLNNVLKQLKAQDKEMKKEDKRYMSKRKK